MRTMRSKPKYHANIDGIKGFYDSVSVTINGHSEGAMRSNTPAFGIQRDCVPAMQKNSTSEQHKKGASRLCHGQCWH
jgi:hypothetical protein